MVRRARALRVVLLAAALAAGAGSRARAEPAPASPCTRGARSAIAEIGCELGQALGPAKGPLLVAAAPLVTELEPRDRERLVSRITSVVAGALGPLARADTEPRELSAARRAAGRAGLVHLTIRLARDRLEASANAYGPPPRFWARVKNPNPGALAHAFASRELDAEVRAFLPPVPLVAQRTEHVAGADLDLVAMACGDSDGDGSNELVLVGRRRVTVGRIRGRRFQVEKSAAWNDLGPVAPAPLREPLATAWLARPGQIVVGSSDRAEAVELDGSLAKTRSLGRRLPWPGGGCSTYVNGLVSGRREKCDEGSAGPSFEGRLDAIAGAVLSLPNGGRRVVVAGRSGEDGSVAMRDGAGAKARLERAGAQLAVGDLDGDGTAELVSSVDTLEPKEDAVIVHSLGEGGKLGEKFRVRIASGVRALAICPLEGAGIAPIAIGANDGLWLVR